MSDISCDNAVPGIVYCKQQPSNDKTDHYQCSRTEDSDIWLQLQQFPTFSTSTYDCHSSITTRITQEIASQVT